ncbi:serine hydrolase domain-containing protein [Paenibacillus sp. MBLB4367]|uniref:serine hydrolase domain-containing protein n=1 Tax=Paenibacillus sp. MBLB4367 TaxID=3384767 RepID=UPI0039080E5A
MGITVHAPHLDLFFRNLLDRELSPCFSVGFMDVKEDSLYEFREGFSAPAGYERSPIDRHTRFNIGSVTKIITGSLIVKLIEDGLLTLTTSVQTIIPSFPFSDVTVLHLLTHTAGYEGFDEPWPSKEDAEAYLIKIYRISNRSYSPGERQIYFTQGYTILMDIVEKVTGTSLEQFARETLFVPLEMENTTFETERMQDHSFVLPWNYETGSCMSHLRHAAVTGDSGLYSTADDLMRFAELFLRAGKFRDKRIFSPAGIDLMMREVTNGKFAKTPVFWQRTDTDQYGCFGDLHSPSCIGHPGFSGCMLSIDPRYQRIGVILTNSPRLHSDEENYKIIWNKLMSL